jgi:C-terminal processing protease CtpA/Prc
MTEADNPGKPQRRSSEVHFIFLCDKSPAQAAGFKIGDKVILIDGKSVQA